MRFTFDPKPVFRRLGFVQWNGFYELNKLWVTFDPTIVSQKLKS